MSKDSTQQGFRMEAATILFWGAIWGIFEATVGYALHLIPFQLGSYLWFPAACFFMDRAYHTTGHLRAIPGVALVSAAIKLLNLLSPMRPDYVINPAVSILLEAAAMAGALRFAGESQGPLPRRSVRVLSVNTLWRLLYTLYAAFLMPRGMREVSVIRDAGTYGSFMVAENLISTAVCVLWLGIHGLWRAKGLEGRFRHQRAPLWYAATGALLCVSIMAQLLL